MAIEKLSPITLAPAPRPVPGHDPRDHKRALDDWARVVEQTVRQFEVKVNELITAINPLLP